MSKAARINANTLGARSVASQELGIGGRVPPLLSPLSFTIRLRAAPVVERRVTYLPPEFDYWLRNAPGIGGTRGEALGTCQRWGKTKPSSRVVLQVGTDGDLTE